MEIDDRELVRRVLAGQTDDFRVLVDRHQQPIFRLASGFLGNREDAPENIERNGGQLNSLPDTDSFQIVKGGDLRVAGSAANVVPILQQQFCQISAILP